MYSTVLARKNTAYSTVRYLFAGGENNSEDEADHDEDAERNQDAHQDLVLVAAVRRCKNTLKASIYAQDLLAFTGEGRLLERLRLLNKTYTVHLRVHTVLIHVP